MANVVLARVKDTPRARAHGVFANSIRMWPGETAYLDLDELGITDLSKSKSWEAVSAEEAAASVQPMPIAPVAPHAPGAEAPQVLPSGSRITGTGSHILPGTGTDAVSLEPMSPDKAATLPEPEAPARRSGAGDEPAAAEEPGLLDSAIPHLRQELAKIDDLAEVRRLRDQEVAGKSRAGALEAIDDRIFQLEEKRAEA